MRILFIVFLIATLLVSAPAYAQITVDYESVPGATEAELFNQANVVIRGRVEGRRIKPVDVGPPMSVYSIRILELLKSDGRSSVNGVIDVHRHGGFDSKSVDSNFPPFENTEELVLFLDRKGDGLYWPLNGPDGAFKLAEPCRSVRTAVRLASF
jgi:hypothetical protein